MADARYLIDIILNAKDNTSEAFGKLLQNQKELQRLQNEQQQQNERVGQSFENMTRRINSSQAELLRRQKEIKASNEDQVNAMVKLEQAASRYARAQGDANASDAQRVQALQQLRSAEDALVESMGKGDAAAKRRSARALADARTQVEALKMVRAEADRNAQAEAKADQERQRAHARQMQEFTQQARARQRFREEERRAMQKEEEERRREPQKTLDIINRSESEAARRREADLRDVLRIEADRRKAVEDRMRKEEQELQLGKKYLEQIQRIQRIEEERRRAAERGDLVIKAQLDFDAKQARAEAQEVAAGLRALFDHIEANIDLDSGAMTAHAAEVMAMKELLGKDIEINVDMDVDFAKVAAASAAMRTVARDSDHASQRLGLLRGSLRAASEGFHGSSQTISSFDNFLRGLMSLGIATFFNQLFLLASAAGGALFSLASSAGMAGAAVGGSLVAGIAQALGPLGLLAAAAQRIASVMNAVQQANLLQQQQSYQGAQAARQQASAVDQVRGAEERLADAGRRVSEAQQNVNDARQEGIDKLNELILAQRGLALSVEESESAIRRATRTGDTSALPRAFVRRDEATAELQANRREVASRLAAGPGGSPEVAAANEQLRDAQRAAREAQRSLDGANRSATQAQEGVTAAAGKLNYLMSQLSGAERRLYQAILRLQTVWRDFAQFATEPLINAFTRTINRVIELLQDPRIRNAARGLATTMAAQFNRIVDAFTSDAAIGQLLRIVEQARRNLAPLTDIAINMGKAFADLAEAAGPAFRQIILWVRDISDRVSDFFEQGRKSGALQDFFKEGVVHLKAWGDLIWQVIRLFAALAGPGGGAQNGLKLVRDMADAIRGWADAIETPGTKLNEFFQRFFDLSRKMIEAMAPVFESIANEINKTFGTQGLRSVEGFAAFLAQVLIPAIGNFARALGSATAALGDIIKAHPGIARIASALLATAFGMSVLGRAFAIFGGITRPIGFLIGRLAETTTLTERLGSQATRTAGLFSRARLVIAGPWIALAAVLVILLQRAGKLDDIWRQVIRTFRDIFKIVKPGFDDLKESIEDFMAQFRGGNAGLLGVFLDILTTIASIIGDVLIEAIHSFGIMVGNTIRGVIRVFGGVLDILSAIMAVFRGDFDEAGRLALRGVRKIAQGIFDALWGVLSGIGGFFIRLFRRGMNAVIDYIGKPAVALAKSIIEGILDGLKSLPRLLIRGFRSAINAVGDFIHDIGGDLEDFGLRIIKGIARGIVSGADAVKDAIAGALSGRIEVGGRNINPLSLLKASGGPIPGVGDTDSVPALLTPGEHVLTKQEVQNAGGHGVIFAIRRLLGGGGQSGQAGRYAEGGAVAAPAAIGVNFVGNLESFKKAWGGMWEDVAASARRGSTMIENRVNVLRINVSRLMTQIQNVFSSRLNNMEDEADQSTNRIARFFDRSFDDVQQAVYQGLRYVTNATNESLNAFDAKPVAVSLRRPRGHAGGGMVGRSGERGEDAIPTWLGRGEAVLNWAHQKVVNSALWNQYGTTLDGLFKSTSALHAGTHSPGFATGGFTGPGHSGEGFTPVWNMAKKKFGMTYFTGYDGHNRMTSSGNVSDHFYHRALDMGNGVLTAGEDALNAFVKTRIPQVVKQLIWRDRDQFNGYPIGGHQDHVHLAMKDAFAFNGPLMAKLISRSLRGLSVAKLLAGVTDSDSFDVDHVDRAQFKGVGPLKELASKMVNKARNAANKLIDKLAIKFGGGTDALGLHGVAELGDGPRAQQVFNFFRSAGFTDAQAAAWVGNLSQESGLSTTIVNGASGATGLAQWLGGRLVGLKNFAADRNQNWTSLKTQLDYILYELNGPESAAAAAIRGADTLKEAVDAIAFRYERMGANEVGDRYSPAQTALERFGRRRAAGGFVGGEAGYARGGELPGRGQGEPMSIIAHAGEWILNKSQQLKLAAAMGVSTSAIKRLLGFSGTAKESFADGGEVLHIGDSLGVGIQRALKRMVDGLVSNAREGRNSDQAIDILKQKLKKAYREVIFDVGTNDAHASVLEKNLKRAYRLLRDDQELVLSTVRGPGAAAKNRVLREFAAEHDNVRLVNTRGIAVGPDGIHMDAEGYRQRARLLANAVKGGLGAGRGYTAPVIDPTSVSGLEREMDEVFKAINQIGKKGKLGARIDKFVKNIRNITDDGGYLDQMGEALDRLGTRMETSLALAQQGFRRVGSRLTRRRGGPLSDAVQVANRTVDMYEDLGTAIRTARAEARQGLNAVQAQINRIKKGGVSKAEEDRYRTLIAARTRFQNELSSLDARFAENQENLYKALQDRFEANTEKALRASTQQASGLDMYDRIFAALGNEDAARRIGELQLANLKAQQAVLSRRFAQASALARRDSRWQGIADALADQLRDVTASIFEQTAANLKAVFDNIEGRYANASRQLDIRERLASVADRAGNRLGAISQQQVIGAQRVSYARGEITELSRVLAVARAQGNVGLAKETQERIDELNTSIQELEQSNRELVFTYRQTATEIITGRAERSTGLIGSAQTIIERLGQLTGSTQFGQIQRFLQQSAEQLKIAATEIANNVRSGAGEFSGAGGSILTQLANAFQQSPTSFATKLAELGPAIAALEATMGETERTAFQALIQSMLDNTLAILDNTDQLNKINNPVGQSFSSSLWQNLRMALFNGNGLPLYQYLPHFQAGGVMPYDGPAYLHAGEIITNPRRGQLAPGSEEHTHVHLHNVEKDVDIGHAFEVVEFKRSQRRAT